MDVPGSHAPADQKEAGMDLKERHDGAAPDPGQMLYPSPAQPHGDGRPDGGSAVANLAGEFGAELVRAIRVGLAEVSSSGHGSRGPSQLSWYEFAAEYARAHWSGRAAKTRDEVSDALTTVTVAMLWDLPGRPSGQLLRRALRHWAFVVPGPGQGEMPHGGPVGAAVGGEGVSSPGGPE